ncbi:MAG: ATPase domain-containing protein [Planctomycetota bacterium]
MKSRRGPGTHVFVAISRVVKLAADFDESLRPLAKEKNLSRLQTGIPRLDELLGGGLIPGTLTVVMGATGIGKTQLGLSFANQGQQQEGERGVLFDLTARGDSQNHQAYAERIFDWTIQEQSVDDAVFLDRIWDKEQTRRDFLHLFRHSGRRVTASDMDADAWREWKYEQAKKLDRAIAFFYGNLVHGVRRCVIDGVEPAVKAADSIQLEMFDYIYHQILHKEYDWVARDLFRVEFRKNAESITQHAYDHQQVACMLLYTSHEVMLDDLITRPIESGDELANANTIILMGKTKDGNKMGRALHVAKHRGSACDESIVPFQIDESGLVLD